MIDRTRLQRLAQRKAQQLTNLEKIAKIVVTTNTKGKNHKIENWKSTLLNTLKYISEVKNSVTPQIWE